MTCRWLCSNTFSTVVPNMTELLQDDLYYVLSRLPRDLRKLLKENKLYLAGGCLRALIAREEVADYDIFGADAAEMEKIATNFALSRKGRLHKTDNAITVLASPRNPVQFITRWTFPDAVYVAASFDYSIAQAAIWWDADLSKWQSYCSDKFYPDIAAKRLRYLSPQRNEDAGGSMLRMAKFLRRGYTIAPESMGKVMARLLQGVRSDSNFWDGDEEWQAKVLTALLREVDPLTIIDGVEVGGE
jgi:hypothetical protein